MRNQQYEAAAAYVARHCVAQPDLGAHVGIEPERLAELAAAGVVPQPTYWVGRDWISSAIAQLGEAKGEAQGWYAPAVVTWLRRAVVLAQTRTTERLIDALAGWLAADLQTALTACSDTARAYGWSDMFRGEACDIYRVRDYVDASWNDWMSGAWAVCLRRFDGHHLATKEIERQRIAALMARAPEVDRLALFNAMARLDAVLLPFAPHERELGTPGRFLNEPARRFSLPWPEGDGAVSGPDALATARA